MAPSFPSQFNPARARSYILRLPLFTRCVIILLIVFWLAGLPGIWDTVRWGALIPSKINLSSMYRLNTFPLIHINFFHLLFNVLGLIPLLERFEGSHGSLITLALFAGPLTTLPAGLALLLERLIWWKHASYFGASVWVSVLLAIEAAKAHKTHPYFSIGPYKIPTWSIPIFATGFITFVIPNTSLLVNLCAVAVGISFGLGYLKILVPPEKPLRWIEGKLNLLGRLPHYVSVDQKTYGRYGVLPMAAASSAEAGIPLAYRA